MTLSDFERQDANGQSFPEDLHNYAPNVWPRTTKFTCGEGRVSRGQTCPILRGSRRPSVLKFWTRLLTSIDQIRQGDTCGDRRPDGHVSMGQPCPWQRVRYHLAKISWDLYMSAHGMRNSKKSVHGDQTILEENFYGSITAPVLTKTNCDTNADARSACGS